MKSVRMSRLFACVAIAALIAVQFIESKAQESKPEQPVKPAGSQPAKDASESATVQPPKAADPYVLEFTMKDIDGRERRLDEFKGKVVLMVNVASNCGYTPQYAGLEALYSQRKDAGFVILAFPSNDFGGQEPGSDADIKAFCTGEKYKVTFPLFSKIPVTDRSGKDDPSKAQSAHPLYRKLAAQPEPIGGPPKWNFTKFLVNREGRVVARYEPRVKPDDVEMLKKIEQLLAEKR